MRPLVYYDCLGLTAEQEACVAGSFQQLSQLMKKPPLGVDCIIERAPDGVCGRMEDDLRLHDYLSAIVSAQGTLSQKVGSLPTVDPKTAYTPRLIICCTRDHLLGIACLARNPGTWGVAHVGVAVVYDSLNPCALLHEMLHTLGAEDCYNTDNPQANPGPTCNHPQCIMQWEPKRHIAADGGIPLCRENVQRVKGLFSQLL